MSHAYRAVGWSRQKRLYDLVLLAAVLLFLALFVGVGTVLHPHATAETLLIRGLAGAAFVLLHVVLCIGPLCRLAPHWLPLLYNRRHLGVTMFTLALLHAAFAIVQFHGFGDVNPFVSLLASSPALAGGVAWIPFQPLGLAALVILALMAATSHDFWLANLGARAWKSLHMLVYVAYALVVAHVALGALQVDRSPLLAALTGAGAVLVLGLHVVAGRREVRGDRPCSERADGLVDVGAVAEVPEGRAIVAVVGDERVAVFRHAAGLSALSNVCRHQGGPLGEGRVLDGCVTCPWHGYQYLPESGRSPPPFDERVETYTVHVERGRVLVDPRAHAPGTPVVPARCGAATDD